MRLGRPRTSDAVDAAVAPLARDDDQIATSAPDELERLVGAAGRYVDVITV